MPTPADVPSELPTSTTTNEPHLPREPISLRSGEILFAQGDEGDRVYVLIAGVLGVRVRQQDGTETEIDRLAPGTIVGEMAARGGHKRTATVFAINDAAVMEIDRGDPNPSTTLDRDEQVARWQRLRLAETFTQLLGPLDSAELHTLQAALTWRHLSSGDVLIRQGDPVNGDPLPAEGANPSGPSTAGGMDMPGGMYVVINGRLQTAIDHADGTRELRNEILPGQTVGEYALLTDQPRSATVYAVRETNVVHMPTETFDRLARDNPSLMRHIARLIIERQFAPNPRSVDGPQSIAIVGAARDVDARAFVGELAAELSKIGPTLALDATALDQSYHTIGASQISRSDPAHTALVNWLDELECNNRFLLYVADATVTPWTRRCLDHADRVLIVADSTGSPEPGSVEALLTQREIPLRTDLVLWHPASTEWPSGTAAWLDARSETATPHANPLTAHYHVRRGDNAHMARLARRLAGQAVGLVLSGGSALAYAHLGVLRAMQELDIAIDYVGGSSMGAIISGAVAREYSLEEMEEAARYTAEIGVFDRTLPLAALTRSENATHLMQRAYAGFNIEDLWLPYFCMSTSLSFAEPVIHQRGPLWRAIRASMSLPGIFVPVVEDGNVLVDGSVMDNFPVEIMADLSDSRRIIGVHVNPYKARIRHYDYDTSLSGWQLLASRLNPFGRTMRAPSLLETMMKAAEVNGVRLSREELSQVDLLILPDVSGFRSSDYDQWEPISHTGYAAAIEPLRAWAATQSLTKGTPDHDSKPQL